MRHRIPLDGSNAHEVYLTSYERNWFRPVMYYVAVMDCDDYLHEAIGDNKFGRISIEAEMTADEDHFPYEKQGIIQTDSYLLMVYVILFVLVIQNMNKFENTFGTKNTPHLYCLIAMGL